MAKAKKSDEKATSQPVSPRTPQTNPISPQTNATADSGGPHVPDTGAKRDTGKSKKSDLKVWRVRHDGHDRPGFSIVAADVEARALQLVGDEMIKNDLGHTHGLMEARPVDDEDSAAQFNPSSEGVIHFDNGKLPS
jgi:hypothetical protein